MHTHTPTHITHTCVRACVRAYRDEQKAKLVLLRARAGLGLSACLPAYLLVMSDPLQTLLLFSL